MNLKNEILQDIEKNDKTLDDVLAIKISIGDMDIKEDGTYLNESYENSKMKEQDLDVLDFEYNNGYGTQHIFGVILFRDGSWLERFEYDGSEDFVFKKSPSIQEVQENKWGCWF